MFNKGAFVGKKNFESCVDVIKLTHILNFMQSESYNKATNGFTCHSKINTFGQSDVTITFKLVPVKTTF
jgi:hypothetical protein